MSVGAGSASVGAEVARGAELAYAAQSRRRRDVARLVSLMEDVRASSAIAKDEAQRVLDECAAERRHTSAVVGITGTPGAGKSSLASAVTRRLMSLDPDLTLAIVAVDPSSPTSGGSLLGDRTRMRWGDDAGAGTLDRMYFRSQASVTALGGLAPLTFTVCRALASLYDCVLVETVGIGQSETDIRQLAQTVYLVIAPNGGDDVQMLKAGIIEIPDSFVINKWDEPAAKVAYHQLRASLWLARPFDAPRIKIHCTSALHGDGMDEFAESVLRAARGGSVLRPVPVGPGGGGAGGVEGAGVAVGAGVVEGDPSGTWRVGGEPEHQSPDTDSWARATAYFFEAWVREEWGRTGVRHLRGPLGGASGFLQGYAGFGAAQLAFTADLTAAIADR